VSTTALFSFESGKRGNLEDTASIEGKIERPILSRVRVLVADDHSAVLKSTVRLLSRYYDVVGTVSDGRALLEAAGAMEPDVLVLDISMPLITGIEAVRILKKSGSKAKIVFLTVHEDPDFVRAARAVGALGYVVKQRMSSDLPEAIKRAVEGKSFISPSVNFSS
jgi:DNA-binding NarL/FixJ family response regulator